MRFIKLGLISIVFIGTILTLLSLLLPSQINISRAIDINAPVDSIHLYINDLSKWNTWYAYQDPSKTTLSAVTAGRGASARFGNTEVRLNESSTQRISASWSTSDKKINGEFNIINSAGQPVSTVQWKLFYKVKWYPWEKFASIVSHKTIGSSMEKSLDNLKNRLEFRK